MKGLSQTTRFWVIFLNFKFLGRLSKSTALRVGAFDTYFYPSILVSSDSPLESTTPRAACLVHMKISPS